MTADNLVDVGTAISVQFAGQVKGFLAPGSLPGQVDEETLSFPTPHVAGKQLKKLPDEVLRFPGYMISHVWLRTLDVGRVSRGGHTRMTQSAQDTRKRGDPMGEVRYRET
jgi:hypothetical protein